MSTLTDANLRPVKALVFDLIGTCTNWHTSVSTSLRAHTPANVAAPSTSAEGDWADRFAHHWRSAFFTYLQEITAKGDMVDGAQVYKHTLRKVQKEFGFGGEEVWGEDVVSDLVSSWEGAEAWPDTAAGLRLLRQKFILIGLTNGTTLTTIKINRRNGLEFDGILNSDVIGAYKPNPKMYETAMKALKAGEGEVAMVAAHKYDLDAAKKHVGMKTIYIRRPTEDMDVAVSEGEVDMLVAEGGLVELARRLGCEV